MALNANIILAGQPVDAIGSLSRGQQAAAQTNALRTQNDLTNLYRTQGAGILAGEQGALNALAGIDPMAALGVQKQAREFQIMNAQERRAIAEAAAKMDERQKAAALEQTKREVFRFLAAPDAATFDMMVTQAGKPELAGMFDRRQILAADYVTSVEEALRLGTPGTPSPQDRYKVVGGSLFDLQAEGGPRPVGQGAMQEETIFGPDGKPLIVRGGPGSGVKFTEGQSKDNVYATRARGALEKLEPVAEALTSRGERIAEGVPLGLARGFQSEEFQVAKNAGDEFLQAILRKDTGAAITAQEQDLYGTTYLPQPGDGPAVLEAKREARARALAAIEAGMNADQLIATERALIDAARTTSAAPQTGQRLRYNPETGTLE